MKQSTQKNIWLQPIFHVIMVLVLLVGPLCYVAMAADPLVPYPNINNLYLDTFNGGILLPSTGQNTCYDTYGNTIDCAGTGQDGEFQSGLKWPIPRYSVAKDTKCIIDNLTGLMWARDPSQFGGGFWQAAIDKINSINNTVELCGYSDWRMPNFNEFDSLASEGGGNNADWLNSQGFINIPPYYSNYWSSTKMYNAGDFWAFDPGRILWNWGYANEYALGVWPVRTEKTGIYKIPKTGDKVSSYPGDDGDLKIGQAWPIPRFIDNGNATITDQLTGLDWSKDASPSGPPDCSSNTNPYLSWQGGLDFVKCLNQNIFLGFNDWRMPNRVEMLSLIERSSQNLLPEGHPFINLYREYWTSTTRAAYSNSSAWDIEMQAGFTNSPHTHKFFRKAVWPVRKGLSSGSENAISINSGDPTTYTTTVTLSLSATNPSGVAFMLIANDANCTDAVEEPYATSKQWTLTTGNGTKTVYVKFKNTQGIWSQVYSATIILDMPIPVNGACGSANGNVLVAPPASTDLCTAVYPSIVEGNGPWNWICYGINGGTNAICSSQPAFPPLANASPDQTVHAGTSVTLNGSNSLSPQGSTLSYLWRLFSAPEGSSATLINTSSVIAKLTTDLQGDYIVELVVTDSYGLSSTPANVKISTTNSEPVPDPGADQALSVLGSKVTLDCNSSYDLDGDPITCLWAFVSKPEGSNAIIDSTSIVKPTFTADKYGSYVLALIVSDQWSKSNEKNVTVSFTNLKPVANPGNYQTVDMYATVSLNGEASSDANKDTLSYSWSIISKPAGSKASLSGANTITPSFMADVNGLFVVSLIVNDGQLYSEPVNVLIQVVATQSVAVNEVRASIDVIDSLPLPDLKNKNLKNPFINKLQTVIDDLQVDNYQDALDKLQHDLLAKTDGCHTGNMPDNNDWITDCQTQSILYNQLMRVINVMQYLTRQQL